MQNVASFPSLHTLALPACCLEVSHKFPYVKGDTVLLTVKISEWQYIHQEEGQSPIFSREQN